MRNNQTNIRLQLMLDNFGLSQKEFAAKTGLTESTVCRYIQGSRIPNATSLVQIADSMGVSPNWILGYGSDDKMERL